MTATFSTPHVVPPTATHPHTGSIIFLHGRGSNATEFSAEIFESQDSNDSFLPQLLPGVKWIFPCAPLQHASLEDEQMHHWFDMSSVQDAQRDSELQKPGLWESARHLIAIVEAEAEIVGMENVLLAGISQGCATAIFTMLTTGLKVGGFIGLSGWLPLADEIQRIADTPGWNEDVRQVPVLLQHCRNDTVVPVENGEHLKKSLERFGLGVEWNCFEEGGHWLNEPEGIDRIVRFVKRVMETGG